LLILPLIMDALALVVLRVLDALSLTLGDSTVSRGLVFQPVHVLLSSFEAASFFPGQLARLDASFDSLFLPFLSVVDARRGLPERVPRKDNGCGYEGCDDRFIHDALLQIFSFTAALC
jgi:hypothetical protein